jgi:transposase-like protein
MEEPTLSIEVIRERRRKIYCPHCGMGLLRKNLRLDGDLIICHYCKKTFTEVEKLL